MNIKSDTFASIENAPAILPSINIGNFTSAGLVNVNFFTTTEKSNDVKNFAVCKASNEDGKGDKNLSSWSYSGFDGATNRLNLTIF